MYFIKIVYQVGINKGIKQNMSLKHYLFMSC
jgi:hypothetical protein